jgi:hypothetical protein
MDNQNNQHLQADFQNNLQLRQEWVTLVIFKVWVKLCKTLFRIRVKGKRTSRKKLKFRMKTK